MDPWEDHTVLKSQPHHQARLGGHQQLPLSPLVQRDQGDSQGKARPTEIATQGYEEGPGSDNPPSLPIADPPPRYPRAPGPPARLFVLCSRRRRCAGVGCSPRRCFALSLHGAARLGLPAWRCGRSCVAARGLAGGLTAVTSPAWRGRGGPHCLPPQRGPATMSRTLNCCCETDGVSQAQGEAKVRGQGEQRGGHSSPAHPPGHGEEGAPRAPRVSAGADAATATHGGRDDGSPQPTQCIQTQGPPPRSLPATWSRQQQSSASRDVRQREAQEPAHSLFGRCLSHLPSPHGRAGPSRKKELWEHPLKHATPRHPAKRACPRARGSALQSTHGSAEQTCKISLPRGTE